MRGPEPSSGPATAGEALVREHAALWSRLARHPFVAQVGDGELPAIAFDRWLVADHSFVVGFRRFLAGLVALAPSEPQREVLAGGLAPLQAELALFRRVAAQRRLDLGAEPGPTALGYTSYLLASLLDGWDVAVTVLYGAERAYFDAWRAVRGAADTSSPYWPFVDNWSSDAFAAWVDAVGGLVPGPSRSQREAFGRVVRFELAFWDAVSAAEQW